MNVLRRLKSFHVLGLLVAISMIVAACAPAAPADSSVPAAEAPAEAAVDGDLPAEPGRGTDGTLTILYWQAVSILNPYLSGGTKDFHASSLIVEPLVVFDPEGNIVPRLATEVPTVENGGISEDLTSITWNLRDDIVWSDGTPFTAEDVVFSWEFCVHPETGCSSPNVEGVANVVAVDEHTVRVEFAAPTPFPYTVFSGHLSPIIQKAQFEECIGAAAQGCSEQNTAPIGTGPYKVREFLANDVVVYEINENYRDPDKPHFSEVIFKGGGDAAAAARAVLETSEADYAWNLQVEPQILEEMEAAGSGQLVAAFAGNVERILINFTNPDSELGELRSEWEEGNPRPHPFLSDLAVRQALSMAIDRNIIAEQLYGPGGVATCNILSGPPAFVSDANDGCLTQDIEGANQVLEDAGWVDENGDGIREKDGVELRILYATSTNSVRQKTQALIKQWWTEIGVETELKNADSAVFFGGDPASPDTYGKFYADVQMFTNGLDNIDPQAYLSNWVCDNGANIASSHTNWLGNNVERWCSPEYDALHKELQQAGDPEERYRLGKEMNDMLVQNVVIIPLVYRASVSAHANSLEGIRMTGWESEEWNIQDWHRAR